MTEKSYPIPEEIINIADEANALKELRDEYVKRPFGFKKARRCAIDAAKKRTLFWRKVRDLYPELYGKKAYYKDGESGIIIEEDKKVK